MDSEFENKSPEEDGEAVLDMPQENVEQNKEQPVYTDPNAVYRQPSHGNYNYGDPNAGYGAGQQQNTYYGTGSPNQQSGPNQDPSQNPNQTYYTPQQNHVDESPLSLGEWLLTLLIGMVPCFGLIVYCIWAFGSGGNVNRKNFCRAYLIVNVIAFVIVMFFFVIAAVGIGLAY